MATRTPLTPKTEPVGPDGLTLSERCWKREADKHVHELNALLTEHYPAPADNPRELPDDPVVL